MVNSPQDLLLNILEIIGYTDDKEAFIEEFIKIIQLQCVSDLISKLTPGKQEELKRGLKMNADDSDKVASMLKTYFSYSQIRNSLENASKNTMTEYIKIITPILSASQKLQLSKMFQGLQPLIA